MLGLLGGEHLFECKRVSILACNNNFKRFQNPQILLSSLYFLDPSIGLGELNRHAVEGQRLFPCLAFSTLGNRTGVKDTKLPDGQPVTTVLDELAFSPKIVREGTLESEF